MKYYFKEEDDYCYDLETQMDYMRMNNLKEVVVYEAVRDVGAGFFTCIKYGEVGESSDCCGKQCDKYAPRNGKNGICKFHRNTYSRGEKTILKLKH